MDFNNKFSHLRELYLPYKFELLLRGSRDGFTPKKFHELCDNKRNTVTFIKVKRANEILGGYNPLKWETSYSLLDCYGKTKDSFIFSFKIKNNLIKNAIISNVVDTNNAIGYYFSNGPQFGDDIVIQASSEFTNYKTVGYKKCYYEKMIRDTESDLSIEDYEVFQIIER